ncbi:MAG TPA: hypothetical protein VGT44_11715, partial [Ktedonobacteraceae bacterium]|nr:hypothetical protein [Ktedonobacteraceae bacterium]
MSKLSLNVQIAFRQRHTFLALALVFLVLLIAGIVLFHHNIVLLLLLSVLFALIASSAAVLLARPLAIFFYIRSVQAEQRQNSRLYVPLSAMKNMYQTPVHYRDVAKDQRQDVTTLIRQSLTNILFLGLPGAGKTVTLRAYQFAALRDRWRLLFGNKPIPLYVSMREYNVALHEKGILAPSSSAQRSFSPSTPTEMLTTIRTLLTYLLQRSDQAGITYLQPYLEQLIEEGRLLFLCDGLNEVDTDWLGFVSWELMFLMRHTQNKVVMTCRELDYRDRDELRMLVEKNFAAEALILPLTLQQMKLFVTQYIAYSKDEDKDWLYTPEQINDAIEHSNLSYNCNNPMMLLTVMHTMNELGPAQTISLNTRGKLLNSFVLQLIHREQARPQWTMPIQDEQIMRFLSYVACIGRRAGFRISIPLDKINAPGTGNLRRALPVGEQAALLQNWLDTTIHQLQAQSRQPGNQVEYQPQLSLGDIEYLLDFAQSAALITISHSNILSFRHELIEEYFVAEYLRYLDTLPQGLPFVGELVQSIGLWSEPAAIWAGMLADPMDLARKFAAIGASYSQSNPGYAYNALALSFICAGTTWTSPKSPVETGRQQPQLPGAVRTLLESFVPDQDKCRDLAGIIKRSAKEGGGEVYRSLLPLLIDGNMIDLMLLLDREEVLAFLFNNLHDTVAMGMVDQTANLVKTLGSFGDDTVNYAAWLLSEPGLTSDLHATILDILGRTASQRAVRLLCNRLEIEEERIQKAVVNALVVLGPALVLEAIVDEL